LVSTAFGERNRLRLIEEYFSSAKAQVSAATAWAHVYRLLLWTDRTTGLAHCYESDKCQPGKPWYARSLAFHGWLATALNAAPAEVGEQIDWMFQRAASELAAEVLRKSESLSASAAKQRLPYDGTATQTFANAAIPLLGAFGTYAHISLPDGSTQLYVNGVDYGNQPATGAAVAGVTSMYLGYTQTTNATYCPACAIRGVFAGLNAAQAYAAIRPALQAMAARGGGLPT